MVRRSPRAQHVIHQPRQKLHRQILEGERRPVEQLERENIDAELNERRDRRMAEGAVGLVRHPGEIGLGDRIRGEAADHLDGDLGIGPAGEALDRLRLDPRPGLRHVEPAIAGKPGEHCLGKAECGSLSPGRDVLHADPSPRPSARPGWSR